MNNVINILKLLHVEMSAAFLFSGQSKNNYIRLYSNFLIMCVLFNKDPEKAWQCRKIRARTENIEEHKKDKGSILSNIQNLLVYWKLVISLRFQNKMPKFESLINLI